MANHAVMSDIPDELFHVLRTMTDLHHDPSGATQSYAVLGTFTTLSTAKSFARTALLNVEGYPRDNFSTYLENNGEEGWPYGDGVVLHAVAPSGEVFEVKIDTTTNPAELVSSGGEVDKVTGELWYILQTTIYYNLDRSGGKREVLIEGAFRARVEAWKRAQEVLLDDDVQKDWFEEYDERGADDDDGKWEYGEDTVVHAVGKSGENFFVEVVRGKGE